MGLNKEAKVAELIKCGFSELQAMAGIRCGFKCEYCGRDLLASIEDYDTWQWDHLEPASKGGAESLENGAIACKLCNTMKRAFRPERSLADGRAAFITELKNFLIVERKKKVERLDCIRRVIGYESSARSASA